MTDPQHPLEEFPEDQVSDPAFDLRRGLVLLVTAGTFMVVVTLICVWIAGR